MCMCVYLIYCIFYRAIKWRRKNLVLGYMGLSPVSSINWHLTLGKTFNFASVLVPVK